MTITTDERYSVSTGPGLSRSAARSCPQPHGLFTLTEPRDLICRDGSVLVPLPCAAGSLHRTPPPQLPRHPPARPAACSLAHNVLSHRGLTLYSQDLHLCYIKRGARQGLADGFYPCFVLCSFAVSDLTTGDVRPSWQCIRGPKRGRTEQG